MGAKRPLRLVCIYIHLGGLGGGSGSSGTQNFNYTFHGDPKATFAQFFGSSNPFENFFNMPGMGGSTQAVLYSHLFYNSYRLT